LFLNRLNSIPCEHVFVKHSHRMFKVLLAVAAIFVIAASARSVDDEMKLFQDFMNTYGRKYATEEIAHKFKCFRINLRLIDERNAQGAEQHGVNQFADLCQEEFARMYLGMRGNSTVTKRAMNVQSGSSSTPPPPAPPSGSSTTPPPAPPSGSSTTPPPAPPSGSSTTPPPAPPSTSSNSPPPSPPSSSGGDMPSDTKQVDWRTKGAVTPIKNQGNCGSCWSFSATGNMEGQWMLAGNTLVGLSEEELVQCSSSTGNEGCNGGLMDWAFEWVTSNGGIDSESDYPYTSGGGTTGTCANSKLGNKVAKFSGHTDMPKNENSMATWVYTNGPLAIGVDALTWSSYTGGIVKNCPAGQLDHGVLIVGFNDANSPPYWIVKNSWGTSWGENGYIRLEKGTDQCGLTQAASSAIAQK